jgi:predicted nucleic acid-binding protein
VTDYFFDTSAVVKRHIVEVGSAWVQRIAAHRAGNTIFIAQITPAEVVSAAMRRYRNGAISARTAQSTRTLIDAHVTAKRYLLVQLTDAIVRRAEDLLEKYPLRAYDSIQLASALEANAALLAAQSAPLIFVSADRRLLDVALAEGLTTDDPNAHP